MTAAPYTLHAGARELAATSRRTGRLLTIRSFEDAMRLARLATRRTGLHVTIRRLGRDYATTGTAREMREQTAEGRGAAMRDDVEANEFLVEP